MEIERKREREVKRERETAPQRGGEFQLQKIKVLLGLSSPAQH
jgi:hypothetical protein